MGNPYGQMGQVYTDSKEKARTLLLDSAKVSGSSRPRSSRRRCRRAFRCFDSCPGGSRGGGGGGTIRNQGSRSEILAPCLGRVHCPGRMPGVFTRPSGLPYPYYHQPNITNQYITPPPPEKKIHGRLEGISDSSCFYSKMNFHRESP